MQTMPLQKTRKNSKIKSLKGGAIRYSNVGIGELGYQPIHIAAQNGNADEIRALVAAGIDINTPAFNGGWTPLHIAAAKCRPDTVSAILDISGVDINAAPRGDFGTPLYNAIIHNCLPVVQRLLQDPCIQVNNGRFPGPSSSSLNDAINGNVDDRIIAALLAHPDIDINAPRQRQVPLYNAVINNNKLSVLRMLLNAPGIHMNPVGPFGQTPLTAALMDGKFQMVREFFSHPEVDIQHLSIVQSFNQFPLRSKELLVEEYRRRNIPLPPHWDMNAQPNNNNSNNNSSRYSNNNSRYNSNNNSRYNRNNRNIVHYDLNHTNIRNIQKNAINAITMEPIEDSEKMVTFHGNLNRANSKRFYTRATFNSLATDANTGYKKNPFTRKNIKPANVHGYTAHKVGGKYTMYKNRKK